MRRCMGMVVRLIPPIGKRTDFPLQAQAVSSSVPPSSTKVTCPPSPWTVTLLWITTVH